MKKPEPWPRHRATAATRSTAHARGQTSGPPKRRKKRSIGEPGWNGKSSSLVGAVVLVLAGDLLGDVDLDRNHRRLHALDDVGKADRPLDLADFVVDLRVRRAGEDIDRALLTG